MPYAFEEGDCSFCVQKLNEKKAGITTILNTIMIYFYINYLLSPPNIQYSLMLIFLTLSVRIVGEALNIIFYKKYHYVWYTNTAIYFPIVLISICSIKDKINISGNAYTIDAKGKTRIFRSFRSC